MELEIIFRFPSRINCNAPQLFYFWYKNAEQNIVFACVAQVYMNLGLYLDQN